MAGWLDELSAGGYDPDGLVESINRAAAGRGRARPAVLSARQLTAVATYALGPSGRLAQQKVFTRADVAVAVGPLLFGFGPRELLRVIEAVCGHPDAIALIGVKAAREQAFAPACVIANESAIALKAALQTDRRNAPGSLGTPSRRRSAPSSASLVAARSPSGRSR